MGKNKALKAITVATLSVTAFMSFGWSFFEMMVRNTPGEKDNPRRFQYSKVKINHPRHKFEKEYEAGKAWCREQEMEDCYIKSMDDLLLHASYLKAEDARRMVILCHGYRGSGFGDFANIARYLHENGSDLLFIDERSCGLSEGEYITFGAREQYDIQQWAYFMAERNTKHLPMYLFGTSMGAASVLMASAHSLPEEIKGLIADSAFRSMRAQLQDVASNWFHIHWIGLLLVRVDWFCGLLGRFRMKEADTTQAMRQNTRPVLFFHGMEDTFVDPRNSVYHYANCTAQKELVMIPNARHLCCAYEDEERYRSKITNFFEKFK